MLKLVPHFRKGRKKDEEEFILLDCPPENLPLYFKSSYSFLGVQCADCC